MKTSQNGINLIKQFEGCSLKAYKDPAGVLTIGYGHTGAVKASDKITQQQADAMLAEDLKVYEDRVLKYNKIYNFNQNEFDALVSFCYNIGNIKTLTNDGKRDRNQIAQHMLDFVYAGGTKLNGLVRRRNAEKELFYTKVKVQEPKVEVQTPKHNYKVGKTYTTQVAIRVRTSPSVNAAMVGYNNLTADAKKHDKDRNGSIDKGTVVTCKEIKEVSNNIWMRIPSGWIAAIYQGEVYVK